MTLAYAIIGIVLAVISVTGLFLAWLHNRRPGE